MSLLELSSIKRVELYKSLINNKSIDKIKDSDLNTRYSATVNDLRTDLEKNYPGLLEDPDKDNGNSLKLEDVNKVGGSFVWNNDNIPTTTPEYYVYDNSDNKKWDVLRRVNAYPDAMDNVNATCKIGDDNFETYNNVVFSRFFDHIQASITPKEDKTIDGWFDVGLKCVMYQGGRPYTVPNFQKSFYVWYLRGDGSDYPYMGQFGASYPGQDYLFKYRYVNAERCMVKSGTVIKIKGTNPTFRYGSGQQGFYARLNNPDEYTNSIAKIDLGLVEQTGQRWHHQGFSLKCYRIFSKYPTRIELNMEGEKNTLDITKLIETNLTWEFDEFTILSSNNLICAVEHDWVNDPKDPKYVLGPSKIELIGGYDGTATLTITARPKGSLYKEIITIDVVVKQLYNGITTLLVEPEKIVLMQGNSVNLNITTDAPNWTATTDTLGIIKIYPDRVEGLKPGKGNLTIKAQANRSMPTSVTIPFLVTKFIPDPTIDPNVITLTVPQSKTLSFNFTTNCPRNNIIVDQEDFNAFKIGKIRWEAKTQPNPDKRASEYPIHTGWLDVTGVELGTSSLYITGYVQNGGVVLERTVVINVIENLDDIPDVEPDDGSDRLATIKKDDAYLSFHHQHQGQFTYLVSNYDIKDSNKILIVPKPEDYELNTPNNPDNEFELALVEDMTLDAILGKGVVLNPNNLDYKNTYDPPIGFEGVMGKNHNVYINTNTLEIFTSSVVDSVVKWTGSKGGYVNDIDYPFPGEKGFGVGPCSQEIAAFYGLTELPGCWDRESENYGHYLDYSGTELCFIPLHYYMFINNVEQPTKLDRIEVVYPMTYTGVKDITDYEVNANGAFSYPSLKTRDKLYIKGTPEHTALTKRLVLPLAFINCGKLLPGIFIDKNKTSDFTNMYMPGQRGGYTLQNTHKVNSITNRTYNVAKIDKCVLNPLKSKTRPDAGIVGDTYKNRVLTDTSFISVYIRNMINYDSLSHSSNCNHFSTQNCDWMHNGKGQPSVDYKTNLNTYNKYFSKNIKNTVNRTNYGRNLFNSNLNNDSLLTHTGESNGILGVADGVLELAIGAHYVTRVFRTNNQIASTNLHFVCGNFNMDYRAYTDFWIRDVNESLTDVNKSISVIAGSYNNFQNIDTSFGYTSYINNSINKGTKAYIKNNYTLTDTMAELYKDNIVNSNVHKANTIDSIRFNLGMIGNNGVTNVSGTYESYITPEYPTYNIINTENILPKTTFGNVNVEDNRTTFFYGIGNRYDISDLADDGEFSYFSIPLYGGIVSSDSIRTFNVDNVNASTVQLDKIGMLDVTWWRLGYNIGNHTPNNYMFLPVASRLCILPDMEKISMWLEDGLYQQEYLDKNKTIFKLGLETTMDNNPMYSDPFVEIEDEITNPPEVPELPTEPENPDNPDNPDENPDEIEAKKEELRELKEQLPILEEQYNNLNLEALYKDARDTNFRILGTVKYYDISKGIDSNLTNNGLDANLNDTTYIRSIYNEGGYVKYLLLDDYQDYTNTERVLRERIVAIRERIAVLEYEGITID